MKKSPRHRLFRNLFWLFAVVVGLWVAFIPPYSPPKHHMPSSVRVKVEQPPSPLPKPVEAELPPPPPVLPDAKPPPVGDEQAEPQVASAVIPPSIPNLIPRPAPHPGQPRIAIVLDDLGLDMGGTKKAIGLPSFVTLSFMSYASRLKQQTREGRDHGHELLLHMPMEPVGHADPGPGALLVGLPQDELRRRFETALASFAGFDGVNNHMGSKFTTDAAGMEIVIDELQQRHLFFLDSRTSGKSVGESIARQRGLPTVARDIFLDDDEAISAIREQMEQAERIARRKGTAVVIGHPHPATLEALESWIPDAQSRGFVFVPVRDLVGP